MPATLTIRLRAARPFRPDTRQLHGLACALFENQSAGGHEGRFAVWPLDPVPGLAAGQANDEQTGQAAQVGDSVAAHTRESVAWVLRAAWLPDTPMPASAIAPPELRLGHVRCTVAETTHHALSCRELASGEAAALAHVSFASPCFFAHNGTDVITPEPRLIIGSWYRRWNAALPEGDKLAIGEETWRELLRAAHLAEFRLGTRRRDSGHGRERTGFVGTATLTLDRTAPARARRAFGTLSRFARFCGTGAQTTHGFGATQVSLPAGPGDG